MVLSWGVVNFLKVVSSFHVSCRQYCVHVCVHVCVCVCVCLYVEIFRIRVRSLTKEIQQLPEISSTNTGGYILFPVCYEWSISTLFCKVLFFVHVCGTENLRDGILVTTEKFFFLHIVMQSV